jgi:hypothetical protein
MTRARDPYAEAAQRIARADDPCMELLRIAQLASRARRRARQLRIGGAILGVLLVAFLAWRLPAGGDHPPTTVEDPPHVDVAAESRWARSLFDGTNDEPLDPSEVTRLAAYAGTPEPGVVDVIAAWVGARRDAGVERKLDPHEVTRLQALVHLPPVASRLWAVALLSDAGQPIDEDRLLALLRNPQPAEVSVVLIAVMIHASRTGTFADPKAVEAYAFSERSNLKVNALFALGAMKDYRPTEALMELIRNGDKEIRLAGSELLRRAGQ